MRSKFILDVISQCLDPDGDDIEFNIIDEQTGSQVLLGDKALTALTLLILIIIIRGLL
jgi:hypothetical protein